MTPYTLSLVTFGLGSTLFGCSRTDAPHPAPSASQRAAPRTEVVRVAAASDLAGTLEEIGKNFEKKTGALTFAMAPV